MELLYALSPSMRLLLIENYRIIKNKTQKAPTIDIDF
jgi:hypothetical protein